nr:MAG TPA: repressor domain protein [Caudoviricetes sp.]
MESNIEIFENPEFGKVRTIVINDEPWFVGKDVAMALGYTNPQKAIRDHVDAEDTTVNDSFIVNGTKGILINESGLYGLIISSKLPTAKKFKHWVTSEVLPSIRKTGSYNMPDFSNPAEAARAWADEYEAKQKLLTENKVMKPKAEYFDCLVDRNLLTNFRTTAKEFHMKQKQFINWLLGNKFVYRDAKGSLQPYSEYTDYFHVKDVKSTAGNNWTGTQTLITPKGKEAFRLMLGK